MANLYKFKVFCNDHGSYQETGYVLDAPTTCPTVPGHTDIEDVVCIEVVPYEPQTAGGIPVRSIEGMQVKNKALVIAMTARSGEDFMAYSHNFCDPTTWYTGATQQEDVSLTDSGDGLTFNSGIVNWIDLFHGKVNNERAIRDSYAVVVKVNGVEKTHREPFATSGGDYDVNFVAGTVTFFESQDGNTVMATFWKANGSEWDLVPTAGKIFMVKGGKAVISPDDWDMTTSLHYQIVVDGYGVVAESVYDTAMQLFVESDSCSGDIEGPIGGAARGFTGARRGMKLHYETSRDLDQTAGVRLRIALGNGDKFNGTWFSVKLTGEVEDA